MVENFLNYAQEKSYTCMTYGDSFKNKGVLAAHQKSDKEKMIQAEGCEEKDDAEGWRAARPRSHQSRRGGQWGRP